MSVKINYKKTIGKITFPVTKAQNNYITKLRDNNLETMADNIELRLCKDYVQKITKGKTR